MKNLKRIGLLTILMAFLFTLTACNGSITISFETNGGNEIADMVLDEKILTTALPTPVKAGYTFEGWFYDEAFSSDFSMEDIMITNVTLYAKWAINHPTITFDVLGGSAVEAISQDYDTAVTAPAAPTKTGYAFGGWFTDEACTTAYAFSTMPEADLTLYAKWTINAYTITFMVDGASYTVRNVEHGSELTDIPTVPAKTGYGAAWDIMDFTSITADMTVTAVYSLNTYTITYVNSFGTTLSTGSVNHGDTLSAPADPAAIEGYNFNGWTGYNFVTPAPVSGPLTIVANYQIKVFTVVFYGVLGTQVGEIQQIQWGHAATAPTYNGQPGYVVTGWDKTFDNVTSTLSVNATFTLVSYTISFDENEGSAVTDINAAYLSVLTKPADPIRPGYIFGGWYSDETLTQEYVFTAQSTMPLDGMTLYANWDEAEFVVSFQPNGGTAVTAIDVVYLDLFGLLPTPTKTGYTFAGWYLETELTNKIESTTQFTATSNITLYAKWTINQYTISFNVNGGTAVASLSQDFNTAVTAPIAPTQAGFTFAGWYSDAELTNAYVFTTMPSASITLYAKWTVNAYTITFDSKDGSAVASITQNFGTAVTVPAAPEKAGYSFITWCSDVNATLAYAFTTMPAGDITLYAKWAALTDIQYTVEYYAKDLTGDGYSLLESDGTFYGVTDTLATIVAKTITGYSFDSVNANNVLTGTITADGLLTLKVYYTRNTDTLYKVEHWQQNIADNNFAKFETDNMTGVTGALVSSIAKNYDGFTYDPTNVNAIANGTILADGTRVLKVYYTRNTFTVGLDFNDGVLTDSFTVKFGAALSLLPTPTRTGYTFQGWIDELGAPYTTSSIANGSLDLYASWKTQTFTVTVIRQFYASNGTTLLSTDPAILRQAAYGSTYTPITSLTGNDFISVVKGVDTYTNADFSFVVTGDTTIYVSFKVRIITIVFSQNPTGSLLVTNSFTVDFGGALNDVAAPTPRDGYTVIWDHSIFTYITENMTVYAIYYQAGIKSVTFVDNGVITAIINNDGSAPEVLLGSASVWTPSKPGFRFEGWFDAAVGGNQWTIEEMLWANVTDNLPLYARWTALESFPVPTNVAVADETETVTWIQGKLNDAFPTQYYILIDGMQYDVLASACTVDPVSGAVSYTFADGRLLVAGTHTISVKAAGDDITNLSSEYSTVISHLVETAETEDPGEVTETKIYDYFIIEKTTTSAIYIFYTDMVYNFSSGYTFAIINGFDYASANGNKITTGSNPGTFKFTVTTAASGTKTYFGKVVSYINQFTLGSNLSNYSLTTLDTYEDNLPLNMSPYVIGSLNNFHLDLRILDNTGARVEMNETEMKYTFYKWNGTAYEVLTTNLADYITSISAHEFKLTTAANGLKFKVEVEPKYQATQVAVPALSFEFVVNGGYNAYTNADLQAAFADLSVQIINLQANIKATLRADQMNADGSPKNGYNRFDENGNYIGGGEGSVYGRYGTAASDNLVVNGNYFTVDGSDLPFINKNSDPYGECTTVGFAESFEVMNVQLAIFHYYVKPLVAAQTDNSLDLNNLTIIGNTVTPSVNYNLSAEEIASAETLMSRNSGGLCGVMVRSATSNNYNVNVGRTTIAFFSTIYGTKLDLTTPLLMNTDYVHVYDSWANSYYGWGVTGFNVTHSNIETSGGAAIHVEDVRPEAGIGDPTVSIDTATQINNWVSGQEAWFKAYGMTTTVTAVKSNVQGGISPLGKSILVTKTNPVTGLQTEMINFIMLSMGMDGAQTDTSDPIDGIMDTGSQVSIMIPDANGTITNVHRAFNFMDTDLRDAAGSFAFPVGSLSDFMAFAVELYGPALSSADAQGADFDLYMALVTAGQTPEVAQALTAQYVGNVVMFEAFYNISRAQAINAMMTILGSGGTMSVQNAILYVTGGILPAQPHFLEVCAAIPGKPGVSTVLLGLN